MTDHFETLFIKCKVNNKKNVCVCVCVGGGGGWGERGVKEGE